LKSDRFRFWFWDTLLWAKKEKLYCKLAAIETDFDKITETLKKLEIKFNVNFKIQCQCQCYVDINMQEQKQKKEIKK